MREMIAPIYKEVVQWLRNIFMPPSGSATKRMIRESNKIFYEVVNNVPGTEMFFILMIMPNLLLANSFIEIEIKTACCYREQKNDTMARWKFRRTCG
jgi:hypothetical protein